MRSGSNTSTCLKCSATPCSPGGRSSCPPWAITGMVCSSPFRCTWTPWPGRPTGQDLADVLAAYYRHAPMIRVLPPEASGKLEPEALNDTGRDGAAGLRSSGPWPRRAGRAAGQPWQGRVRRGGAEHAADARLGRSAGSWLMPGDGPLWSLDGVTPQVAADAWVAPTATVIGKRRAGRWRERFGGIACCAGIPTISASGMAPISRTARSFT